MNKINFIFWGTPDVASETLEILKQNGLIPSLIVTSPNAPKGRGLRVEASPVALFAEQNNITCLKPKKLEKEEIWNVLRTLGRKGGDGQRKFLAKNFRGEQHIPAFFLVVAYGKIIPENILNIPKLGSINAHYSLLPKYRGASPVESAILNGDTETGITIQKMEYRLDTGPIIIQEKVEINPEEKAGDLRKRLIKIGGELLVKILPDFVDGKVKLTPQNENEATYCKKIKKEDGEIDLNADPIKNYNKFRAYATWPRTFFFKDGKRIIITDATLENGEFKILKIIPEGGKEINYKN